MIISLSDETLKLLEEKLRSGGYGSVDEVVHAALAALNEAAEASLDEDASNAIDRAENQIDKGEVFSWKQVRERVREGFLGT